MLTDEPLEYWERRLDMKLSRVDLENIRFILREHVRNEVRRVRHTQVLKDPFPEHSAFIEFQRMSGLLGRFFDRFFLPPGPEPVSIWKAYQTGYDKAYREMRDSTEVSSADRKDTV